MRYGLQKFFGLKTHVGGRRRVATRDNASRSREDGSWSRADGSPKVKKLWKAISHSKLVQIGHLRCFLASTGNVDAKNTSNARFGQVLSEIWPAEVFWSQNSCGWAQTGRVARQHKQVVRRRKLVAR